MHVWGVVDPAYPLGSGLRSDPTASGGSGTRPSYGFILTVHFCQAGGAQLFFPDHRAPDRPRPPLLVLAPLASPPQVAEIILFPSALLPTATGDWTTPPARTMARYFAPGIRPGAGWLIRPGRLWLLAALLRSGDLGAQIAPSSACFAHWSRAPAWADPLGIGRKLAWCGVCCAAPC